MRYDRTVQHEGLDQYIIETIEEAQHHALPWLVADAGCRIVRMHGAQFGSHLFGRPALMHTFAAHPIMKRPPQSRDNCGKIV